MHFSSPLRKSPRRNTASSGVNPDSHLAPPSASNAPSYSRSGTTFKESLRKIPSTIFTRGEKKVGEKKSMDRLSGAPSPLSPGKKEKEKEKEKSDKKKTKTRKALGGLFNWASNTQPDPPTPPPKVSPVTISRPMPPPTYITRKPALPMSATTPMQKVEKRPSVLSFRAIEQKPSLAKLPSIVPSILEKRTSRAQLAPTTPNVSRASMSEDPFSCDDGAEIVHRAIRQSVCTPSVRSEATARERRRDSTFSDRAPSTKTQGSDEVSVHEVAMRARMSSPRRVTIASVIEEKKRLSAQSTQSGSSHLSHATSTTLFTDGRSSAQSQFSSNTLLSNNTFGNGLYSHNDAIEVVSEITEATRRALPSPRSIMFERPLPAPPVQRVPLAPAPPSAYRATMPQPAPVELPTPVAKQPVLGKTKTKSRVWGFLGKKKGRDGNISPVEISRPLNLGTAVQAPERPVPVLHVSHPSVDVPRNAMDGERPDLRQTKRDSSSSEATAVSAFSTASTAGDRASNKHLPKRKSLNGLFGLDIQRTVSDISEEPTTASSSESTGITNWQPPAIRPLSEDMAEVSFGTINEMRASPVKPVKDLRRVASATDKLISLVSSEFSPACSPTSAGLVNMASFSSLKGDATPTPIRRSQSVMLVGVSPKKVSPPRPTSQLSPIKLALERARVRKMEGVSMVAAEPGLPPNTPPKHNSLVKSGMRNIFAPPSPIKEAAPAPAPTPVAPSPAQSRPSVDAATIVRRPGHGPATGLAGFIGGKEEMVGSLPADLYHMLAAAQAFADPDERTVSPVPSSKSSDRATTPAPGISLPPVPVPAEEDVFADSPEDTDYAAYTSESETEQDVRQSFDFDAHFEELDGGGDRQSFLAALHRAESREEFARPPLPPLPTTLYTIEASPASIKTSRLNPPLSDEPTRRISPARARKAPFQGTFAFQQQVNKTKTSSPLATTVPALPLPPPPPPAAAPVRGHQRGQSNASFASMSSMGDVLDSAETAREYTNYFDVNFGQHLAHVRKPSREVEEIMAFSRAAAHSRNNSVESTASVMADTRAPTRRQHHRRNSSIISIESFGGVEMPNAGPPNSRFNKHRSGYISRHRVNGSHEGSWGRSDWAAHKRNTSTDSTGSNVSLARIGRPGLGERMFERDQGIALPSIEGSPADQVHSRTSSIDSVIDASPTKTEDSIVDADGVANATYDSIIDGMHKPSFDSILDGHDASFDSKVHVPDPDFTAKLRTHRRTDTWESSDLSAVESKRSSATASIFGVDMEAAGVRKGFFLKGVRPVSAISRSESEASDAFIDVAKYARKAEELEDEGHAAEHSFTRPTMRRNKPARIAIGNYDTPGLSSPSTSETSSFMSLDTRFADGHVFGHQRQKSSAAVKPQATIMEEPSTATLKPRGLVNQLSRENLRQQNRAGWEEDEEDEVENVTTWLRFQREANDVCRRTRSFYRDSDESKAAVADFATNFTPQSVADFLAQSAAAFRPLESVQRRRPSFSNSRAASSPYGLPLPKASVPCKPRGSLTTKFERSNSAQSRHSLGPSENGTDTPTSGIFDGFMPELQQPAQRRSTPPSAVAFTMARAGAIRKGSSPPTFAGFAQNPSRLSAPPVTYASPVPAKMSLLPEHQSMVQASPSAAARARVSSGDRRKALGWGKRRDSDGPQKLSSDVPAVPAIPLALARTSNVHTAPRVPINAAAAVKSKITVVVPSPRKSAGPEVYRDEGGKENAVPFARPAKPTQGRVSSRRTGNRSALNTQRAMRA